MVVRESLCTSGEPPAPPLCLQRRGEPRGLRHFRMRWGGSTVNTSFACGQLALILALQLSSHLTSLQLQFPWIQNGFKMPFHRSCCNLRTHVCPGPSTVSGTLKMLSKCWVIFPCIRRGPSGQKSQTLRTRQSWNRKFPNWDVCPAGKDLAE